jgi:hypothetical protein
VGRTNFEVADTLNNVGAARLTQGHTAEGRRLLTRCLEIKRKLLGPHHPEILLTESTLRFADG